MDCLTYNGKMQTLQFLIVFLMSSFYRHLFLIITYYDFICLLCCWQIHFYEFTFSMKFKRKWCASFKLNLTKMTCASLVSVIATINTDLLQHKNYIRIFVNMPTHQIPNLYKFAFLQICILFAYPFWKKHFAPKYIVSLLQYIYIYI